LQHLVHLLGDPIELPLGNSFVPLLPVRDTQPLAPGPEQGALQTAQNSHSRGFHPIA